MKVRLTYCNHPSAYIYQFVSVVSMVDGDLFDKLDRIGRSIRSSERPFGGIQIVLSGDFFQLPPVSRDYRNPAKFAFESRAWKEAVKETIILTRVFRQKEESKFRNSIKPVLYICY